MHSNHDPQHAALEQNAVIGWKNPTAINSVVGLVGQKRGKWNSIILYYPIIIG